MRRQDLPSVAGGVGIWGDLFGCMPSSADHRHLEDVQLTEVVPLSEGSF